MSTAMARRAHAPIGTPLDDGSIRDYAVVTVDLSEAMPVGRVALVLKRLEDEPEVWGVVEWRHTSREACAYLDELARQHAAWLAMRAEDEQRR